MTELVTHLSVGEVYVARGGGMFKPGDLLIYDPDAAGLRIFHPRGTWSEYTVTAQGSCRVVVHAEAHRCVPDVDGPCSCGPRVLTHNACRRCGWRTVAQGGVCGLCAFTASDQQRTTP